MRQDLQEKLIQDHSEVFNLNRSFGIECGDGWYQLLDATLSVICGYQKRAVLKGEFDQIQITQIKEKFGTLRLYYDGGDVIVQELVTLAEKLSGMTCEECGNLGKMYDKGWMVTRCKHHAP